MMLGGVPPSSGSSVESELQDAVKAMSDATAATDATGRGWPKVLQRVSMKLTRSSYPSGSAPMGREFERPMLSGRSPRPSSSHEFSGKKSGRANDLSTMMLGVLDPALSRAVIPMQDDDAGADKLTELAARMRSGDRLAFTAWVRALHPLIYRLCRRLVISPADTDDVVQDTFIRAWRGASALRDPSAHRAWLCQLARRACADRARSARTRERPGLDLSTASTGSHAVVSEERSADEALHNNQVRAGVVSALAHIKEPHRAILLLREVDEMSYDEIADALGVPRGTVESRLHRARAALGRELERQRLLSERKPA